MTEYKEGDLVDEAQLRRDLASARVRLDAAKAEEQAAVDAWSKARQALVAGLHGRFPREDELTYALTSCKGCGAPLAYWPDADPRDWLCADVLLGRVGTPEDKALVGEAPMTMLGQPPLPEPPEGKVVHDKLPFAFWKVKEDRGRKSR